MSLLAQVAVEGAVYHFDKLFTYQVPQSLAEKVRPGVRVLAPCGAGNRERVAMLFAVGEGDPEGLKPLREVLDREPALPPELLELALWMQDRYFCTLFEAVKTMIPAGLQFRVKDSYVLQAGFQDFDREAYAPVAWQVILLLQKAGKALAFEKIAKELGITKECPEFQDLLRRGIVCRVNMAASKGKDAVSKMVRPISGFSGKLTPRQKDVYQTLLDVGEASEKELCYFTGASLSVLHALRDKGAAEIFEYEVYRRPEWGAAPPRKREELVLSPAQDQALAGL